MESSNSSKKWPKTFSELSPEKKAINDDFVRYWHEVLPRRTVLSMNLIITT